MSMEPKFPMPERKQERKDTEEDSSVRLDDVLSRSRFFDAIHAEEYEGAKEEYDRLHAVNEWRKQARQSPAREFYRVVENFSVLQSEQLSPEERRTLRGTLADRMSGSTARMGARAGDLYAAMLAELDGSAYDPRFDLTKRKIAEMRATDDVEYLMSASVGMDSKLEYLAKRFDDYVAGANALDAFEDRKEGKETSEEEREERKEKLENESPDPPGDDEESEPSMDEMDRLKESEQAKAIWLISPARKGYFREKAFDTWDPVRKVWTRGGAGHDEFVPVTRAIEQGRSTAMTAGIVPGRWTRVPIPYTHEFAGVHGGNTGFRFRRDGSGGVSILKEGIGGAVSVSLILAEIPGGRTFTDIPKVMDTVDGEHLSEETLAAIAEIGRTKTGNKARASALSRYVRMKLTYSNESKYNEIYRTDPGGYCHAIDTYGLADCDVANTYFAALCRKLDIPVRHVVGHSVPVKAYGENMTAITSGTGHAWSEIWDDEAREWIRKDATPPGDPNTEEEERSDDTEKSIPGDTGEEEAIGRTDEELAKLEEELAKHVEQLSYTPAERRLAEDTGIELREARQIVKEIDAAENTRLPDGRRVTDALAQLFDMIVESRRHFVQEYTGPIRRRDGGEHVDDIVRHYIGAQAGEADPMSRAKEQDIQKEEKLFGGFDVHLIGDKSGSMSETVDGESKWVMQRRALYLVLSSLHRFEERLKQSGVQAIAGKELDVRTESISFRGGSADELDTDKPLSSRFEGVDKVNLWHSLTEQGGGNGDVTALQMIHQEIGEAIGAIEKTGKKDNRLRIVIAMTDGYPDSVTGVLEMAERLGKLGTVVVGVGLTETAKGVEQIYTTPWSHGDYAESIDDLPAIVAKYVILEAMKLFPEKAQEQNRRALDALLQEFAKKK